MCSKEDSIQLASFVNLLMFETHNEPMMESSEIIPPNGEQEVFSEDSSMMDKSSPEIPQPASRKLVQKQLILLLHSHACLRKDANPSFGNRPQCKVPKCEMMKEVWMHIKQCRVGPTCSHPHCLSSLKILAHWKHCQDIECPVCQLVRIKGAQQIQLQLEQELRTQQNQPRYQHQPHPYPSSNDQDLNEYRISLTGNVKEKFPVANKPQLLLHCSGGDVQTPTLKPKKKKVQQQQNSSAIRSPSQRHYQEMSWPSNDSNSNSWQTSPQQDSASDFYPVNETLATMQQVEAYGQIDIHDQYGNSHGQQQQMEMHYKKHSPVYFQQDAIMADNSQNVQNEQFGHNFEPRNEMQLPGLPSLLPTATDIRRTFEQLGIPCPSDALQRLIETLPGGGSTSEHFMASEQPINHWKNGPQLAQGNYLPYNYTTC